ncbi:hypothetical protein ABI59_23120 [Acidobacteria bacterium Mor1]|nr:hypothetical protein ABI59_23120 [Acidobacteria bacterium Mor1]
MRVLLVDDEEPARERLRRLLAAVQDIEIVGEAEDGPQAVEQIAELEPDVVFLDIQMPGCSGLEVASSLSDPRPRIIFCTAYDQHAVDAFELHAVDYLLKPVSQARLDAAIERLRGPASPRAVTEKVNEASGFPRRLLAKKGSRFHVVPHDAVLYFLSEGGATKLQAGDGHYWMQPTLNDLEKRLDPRQFFRVSRSAIVHLDAVSEVVPLGGGHAEVVMRDDARLEVSRRRYKDLLEFLEQ